MSFKFFVESIQADANPALHGPVVLASGTGVTLTQVGDTITLDAAGGGDVSFNGGANVQGILAVFLTGDGLQIAEQTADGFAPSIMTGGVLSMSNGLLVGGPITLGVNTGDVLTLKAGNDGSTPTTPAVPAGYVKVSVPSLGTCWVPVFQ